MSSAFEEPTTTSSEGKEHDFLLEESPEVESIAALLDEVALHRSEGEEKSLIDNDDTPMEMEKERTAKAMTLEVLQDSPEPLKDGALTTLTTTGGEEAEEEEEPSFHGLFPQRQLFQPSQPYPLWDEDWDGRHDTTCTHNVTRHIILVRHGQYDETYMDDERRSLTELGRRQATLTGERIADMIQGLNQTPNKHCCTRTTIRSSDMKRAKETADIICNQIPSTTTEIHRAEPDPLLNEGVPAQVIPVRKDLDVGNEMEQHGERIETAFQRYFYRWRPASEEAENNKESSEPTRDGDEEEGEGDETTKETTQDEKEEEPQQDVLTLPPQPQHEFDILVCHGNVVRYFFCRALQLPPEAWLRMSVFNCSLTYLMIRPSGQVTCRMLGDIGHLPYDHTSFSMNHGFAWS